MAKDNIVLFTIAAVLFLVVTFVSQYFYEEYLWFLSVETIIPGFQGFKWDIWKRFVYFLSLLGWEGVWVIMVAFYCKFNRVSSAYAIEHSSAPVYIVAMLKMYYNDPAPYMDRTYIKGYECDQNTFQNPSLEVTISAWAYSTMFYLAFDWIDVLRPRVKLAQGAGRELENQPVFEDQEPEWFLSDGSRYQQTKARDFTFWLILSLKIFLVFLIGYAAMYNGINSLDQVIFAMCIGYALFCIFYYYFKDGYCVDLTKISEKMGPFSSTLSVVLVMTVFYSLLILGAKLMYNWQVDGFTVNPRWKSEHLDVCGKLPYPSFFEKELLFIYRFIYLNLGIYFGMTFDALALGGTRIDYNQMRESEGRSPLVGFLVRFIVTIGWILLNLWGLQYVLNLVIHEWLFVLAIPYFLCTFGMFSILKYPFLLLGATKNEIYPIPETSAVELRKAERPTAQ